MLGGLGARLLGHHQIFMLAYAILGTYKSSCMTSYQYEHL